MDVFLKVVVAMLMVVFAWARIASSITFFARLISFDAFDPCSLCASVEVFWNFLPSSCQQFHLHWWVVFLYFQNFCTLDSVACISTLLTCLPNMGDLSITMYEHEGQMFWVSLLIQLQAFYNTFSSKDPNLS